MRVTGGTGRGRRLRVPAGDRVRPTSDKVKQALFNILGGRIEGAVFLDLFAGTGGIGIEALSRGAERAVFVDDARKSLDAVRHNIDLAGVAGRAHVVAAKADAYVRKTEERFDIVFLDPPYTTAIGPLVELIASVELLAPGGTIVAEHFKKQPSPEHVGALARFREAVYGDTVLSFYAFPGDREGMAPGSRKERA